MRVALIAMVAVTLSLSACSAAEKPAAALSTAPIIAPGRPGEPARTLSPSEAAVAVPTSTPNAVDVTYVQNMIVHHQSAIQMAQMAEKQASTQQVKDLAKRIEAAQSPEIDEMTSWLNAWGEPVSA